VQRYASARREERQRLHADFDGSWRAWMRADLWDGLRTALQTPVQDAANLYPPAPDLPAPNVNE